MHSFNNLFTLYIFINKPSKLYSKVSKNVCIKSDPKFVYHLWKKLPLPCPTLDTQHFVLTPWISNYTSHWLRSHSVFITGIEWYVNPVIKVTGCACLWLSVYMCVLQKISLTANPSWFSFTVKLLIGPLNVYNQFVKGNHYNPKNNYL